MSRQTKSPEPHMSVSPVSRLASIALKAADVLAFVVRTTFDGRMTKYSPEDHYMRGPGPKWREKHMFDVTTRGA